MNKDYTFQQSLSWFFGEMIFDRHFPNTVKAVFLMRELADDISSGSRSYRRENIPQDIWTKAYTAAMHLGDLDLMVEEMEELLHEESYRHRKAC